MTYASVVGFRAASLSKRIGGTEFTAADPPDTRAVVMAYAMPPEAARRLSQARPRGAAAANLYEALRIGWSLPDWDWLRLLPTRTLSALSVYPSVYDSGTL